jgi:hypothetical protein
MHSNVAIRHRRLLFGVGALSCVVCFVLSAFVVCGEVSAASSSGEIEADGYTSARTCGECHADIYNSWKNSLHAFSMTDPIFDAAYMQALKVGGDEARKLCLQCHAPMAAQNGDYELKLGVTREGVSCDFCHTVTAVHLDDRETRFSVEPGPVKRSVIKNTSSPAHDVAYSELHKTSEFCGGCHNFQAPSGQLIMGTYDEWKNGPYRNSGVQCQDCHMALGGGKVVRAEIQESEAEIHLHDLIHDTDQLRSALTIQIEGASRTASSLKVDVVVENVGSGHMVPTGMPSREVVLTVEVDHGGRVLTQERRFRKVIANEAGRVLDTDYEALLYGARILNDTRIGPKEKRSVRFTFAVPQGQRSSKVTATLNYRYSPVILHEQRLDVRLGSAERIVY